MDLLVISGNIGTGKSTLINNLKEYIENKYERMNDMKLQRWTRVLTFKEPLEDWKPFLERYYTLLKKLKDERSRQLLCKYKDHNSKNCNECRVDIKDMERQVEKACIDIQMQCFYHFSKITFIIEQIYRKQNEKLKNNDKVMDRYLVMVERSPIETVKVFIKNIKDNISLENYRLLKQLAKLYTDNVVWKNASYIMLTCNVNTMFRRINNSNNNVDNSDENNNNNTRKALLKSDSMITVEYLDRIESLYERCKFLKNNAKIINTEERKVEIVIKELINTL